VFECGGDAAFEPAGEDGDVVAGVAERRDDVGRAGAEADLVEGRLGEVVVQVSQQRTALAEASAYSISSFIARSVMSAMSSAVPFWLPSSTVISESESVPSKSNATSIAAELTAGVTKPPVSCGTGSENGLTVQPSSTGT